ncbi:hypothetical protein Nepgr_022642 [Nepenthes gracilis]|uniref:Uncharacterized protein n=1 Tax=Nepenthes gracilis TaxID=150966 RepID=A0AAD3T138_NEPGR|nr:hypothetical protein Nepgr_022642 [Nepenthes gracilis]
MREIGSLTSVPPTPASRILEKGTRSGFTASGEPPAPSAEVPKELEVVGVVPEEPLVWPTNMGKDAKEIGIMKVSSSETPMSDPVVSSFHPSSKGYRPE